MTIEVMTPHNTQIVVVMMKVMTIEAIIHRKVQEKLYNDGLECRDGRVFLFDKGMRSGHR